MTKCYVGWKERYGGVTVAALFRKRKSAHSKEDGVTHHKKGVEGGARDGEEYLHKIKLNIYM